MTYPPVHPPADPSMGLAGGGLISSCPIDDRRSTRRPTAVAAASANRRRNYGRKRPLAGRPDRQSRTRRAAHEFAVSRRGV
ncbi:hypothetical protein [Halohasta litorea]|uniref:Uncharacterized protein n=1 Tax=Halohasta litorea TaxID=869891 RepID=A0ABD6DCC8_9EURY|nr:hypothetical protein [Halohasta litorea]